MRFYFIVFSLTEFVFAEYRDHYVEGRMRGAAPNKKIPAAPQKNDV